MTDEEKNELLKKRQNEDLELYKKTHVVLKKSLTANQMPGKRETSSNGQPRKDR